MAQIIPRTKYGELEFKRTFVANSDNKAGLKGGGIGELTSGSWCHFPSGHPIQSKSEGSRILHETNAQMVPVFEGWWDRMLEEAARPAEHQVRSLVINDKDQVCYADTGEECLSAADLHSGFKPGRTQDLAFQLFLQAQQARKETPEPEPSGEEAQGDAALKAFESVVAGASVET